MLNDKIMNEARQHGIKEEVVQELLNEYKKIKRKEPDNFAELVEVVLC